jgi:hypothetical protein
VFYGRLASRARRAAPVPVSQHVHDGREFSICFRGRPLSGELRTSEESTDVRWVERDQLDGLHIHPSMRLRINHGIERRARALLHLTNEADGRAARTSARRGVGMLAGVFLDAALP